ncbi:MAG: metal ABC transporter ATP-binding protein [Candidatus Eremiobacteraeota bacterium]|nr:metal ABC transporter ATP-binding protein [Candidatus Eremiobacteraeota bacterium]
MEKDEIIILKNVGFSYGDNVVLENINLTVEEGTILGIIGPNGGGKTTLLKIMLGLIEGYTGKVIVKCQFKNKSGGYHHNCMGYVPQHSKVNKQFPATVYDAVEMGLYGLTGFKGPTKEEKEHVNLLLEKVGIDKIKDCSINAISGGQLQRALIARALVGKPSVLMLDEPLVGIDQTGVMAFLKFLAEVKEKFDLTVVLVTHNFHAMTITADQVACLNKTIHFHDNPEHLSKEDIAKTYSCEYDAFHAHQPG